MKSVLLIASLVCCTCLLRGQERSFQFSHYGLKDGLYEENVFTVNQDQKGYIWVSSENALQRFDGKRFLSFFAGKQLPAGLIRAAKMDRNNRLWLLIGDATAGYFDPVTFRFTAIRVEAPAGYPAIISKLYVDAQNRVYLFWDKYGFITYTSLSGKASAANNLFALPAGWKPVNLSWDQDDQVWVTSAMGLLKYNPANRNLSYRGHNADQDPVIKAYENVRDLALFFRDRSKRSWLVSWGGSLFVESFDEKTGQKTEWKNKIIEAQPSVYFVPQLFTESSDSSVWITGGSLFAKPDPVQQRIQLIPQTGPGEFSIRYDDVHQLLEDKEKNIWIATDRGLYRFNPSAQRFFVMQNRLPGDEKMYNTEVTGVLEARTGEKLVSTWGEGLFTYDNQFRPLSFPGIAGSGLQKQGMIWDLLQRSNGDLWFAMQAGSLFICPASSRKLIPVIPAGVEGATIRQLEEDQSGHIWLGTQRGALIRWTDADNQFVKIQQFSGLISKIIIDSSNHIWVCTDADGVHRFDVDGKLLNSYRYKSQGKSSGLSTTGGADIIQYNDSLFFIAGNGMDILNVNTGKITYFNRDNGLSHPRIFSFQKDDHGYVWMSTAGGIVSYHPGLHKISLYAAEDGVHTYAFGIAASGRFSDGRIAFGTSHDFIVFNPDELTSVRYAAPAVEVAGFEIRGRNCSVDSLLQLKQITLSHEENSFKAFLTTLCYQNSYPLEYKLEELDEDWRPVDAQRIVEYNYLPPGSYVLRLAALNEDGTHAQETVLKIVIRPPFYKTWWFYCAVALVVIAILFWIDRERMKRKEAMQSIRSNIAGKLHQDVNLALNNINILSEMASLKAETEPQKSREFIEQIHTRSGHMIEVMDDMLWSISPEHDSMEKTLERIREFLDEQMNRYGVKIEMQAEPKIKKLDLPMRLRHEAFLLFKESIRGLLRTGATDIRIYLAPDKSCLQYVIEFNNRQCEMKELNHFLANKEWKEKLDAIGANLEVFVHKSHSVLECRIPV